MLTAFTIDYPDLTILGWTPTHDQWVTGTAIVVGAAAALLAMALWRRTRKAVVMAVLAAVLLVVWWRVTR